MPQEVHDNETENRYELDTGRGLAVAEYIRSGSIMTLTHTEVPEALEGQGIGAKLVAAALQDARDRGLKVVPKCPYVTAYLRRHPEFRDLVHPRYLPLVSRGE